MPIKEYVKSWWPYWKKESDSMAAMFEIQRSHGLLLVMAAILVELLGGKTYIFVTFMEATFCEKLKIWLKLS